MGEHRGKNSGPMMAALLIAVIAVMTWACSHGPLFEPVSDKLLMPLIERIHSR